MGCSNTCLLTSCPFVSHHSRLGHPQNELKPFSFFEVGAQGVLDMRNAIASVFSLYPCGEVCELSPTSPAAAMAVSLFSHCCCHLQQLLASCSGQEFIPEVAFAIIITLDVGMLHWDDSPGHYSSFRERKRNMCNVKA